jgi:hypothetical protein
VPDDGQGIEACCDLEDVGHDQLGCKRRRRGW